MNRRGLTLPETIISIFLLAAGFVVLFRLMHAALQYQAGIDSQQTGVMLAERQVERIRAWSVQTHGPTTNTPFSDWSTCPGAPGPAPVSDYPDYQMTVQSQLVELYSPCSLFELSYQNPANRKSITQSVRQLTVTVAWKNRNFSLRTLVAAPTGEPAASNPVEVDPNTPMTLGASGIQDFAANATDSMGRPIPDLMFTWYVDGVGDGTTNFTREGRTTTLVNQIYDAAQPPNPTGTGAGICKIYARARYRGKEIQGVSGQLQMQP